MDLSRYALANEAGVKSRARNLTATRDLKVAAAVLYTPPQLEALPARIGAVTLAGVAVPLILPLRYANCRADGAARIIITTPFASLEVMLAYHTSKHLQHACEYSKQAYPVR